ncbi:hypothetical protein D3874_09045 [Oleomonas cavernae]|uniref:Uncharacterized protein n=1 Tax=Oleomonas cavernae TaxID=2320859 RepID=A0A418WAV3_9PROT|nr:hypothetical protein [Oleomonas cavernae]RJF87152.1 hypothetical protein D3874_09045 [Oleomonas cavernae]
MLHLSTVDDVFELSGRSSVIVVPGIPRHSEHNWKIRGGDAVTLETPDGDILETIVGGIEFSSPPHPDFIPIMLGPGITKQMVPIGTKLWVDESATS